MMVNDKKLRVAVSVRDDGCLRRQCYWPRTDPGVFTQGQGYRSRAGGTAGWFCGTREIEGCPNHADPARE